MSHTTYKRFKLHSHLPVWTSKGLTSSSIREPVVPLVFAGELAGKCQAIEFYELALGTHSYPLTAVDIIANSYVRLSHQKPNGKSATLGSSLVGSISFRTNDNTLWFIPKVTSAEFVIDEMSRPQITIKGYFGELAEITMVRKYHKANLFESSCDVNVSLTALNDINLAGQALGNDAFRFCSISSMYTPQIYDSSCLQYVDSQDNLINFDFAEIKRRGSYLFKNNTECVGAVTLTKKSPSQGEIGSPGANDSPAISIYPNKSEYRLGIQGYLAPSLNVNSDSLSVWLEWLDAPKVLESGRVVSFAYSAKALPT